MMHDCALVKAGKRCLTYKGDPIWRYLTRYQHRLERSPAGRWVTSLMNYNLWTPYQECHRCEGVKRRSRLCLVLFLGELGVRPE